MFKKLPKIIAVVGPTASGKTALGIFLAQKFKGEIISVDSRQIYKGMDIGTAKVEGKKNVDGNGRECFDVEGVRHYGIDLIEPDKIYSVAEFKEYALQVMAEIIQRGNLPILVGGTGFYLKAIVENLKIPRLAPNLDLRQSLEKKDLAELVKELKKIDPVSSEKIDLKNKRRVVRALEVANFTGQSFAGNWRKGEKLFETLELGITQTREVLYQRIDERVEEQIKNGLVEETQKLISKWYKWSLPSMSGIGYKEIGMFLRGEISLERAKEFIKFRTHDYARRQITWFKSITEIKWIENVEEAEDLTKVFLAQ
ncbi:MAG: tRNA dimethylallyltransferase [Candidatus Magasanikbacteria bacterium GW2011_GWC2_40_17]|uniref:tRNA dimethylallyltransferase n=1 Tax=Candidatus Magasanikbacteria bacterium GW2011_GWA2_42_32 TaxID=1619039 RepID=A0A0G1A7Z9_9BACT|nr:MAG: tRNA dimethylallyltransferase [Candidatus Magasanikbacteria bacterium GW2011_GWC2_40_17]KKS57167.1 MAG: tRNA dimethylallyltransferase [Candidatus Magasanikbacteria bacterium GW2011_GWA2_42_32]OGH85313.1 MAG: tRNA (adenosine(37)-N6)-dimethylallyltransferase MiaA [Candidatus Magasanikbacteria bacterium RIFOXYB2_FULL_38_10]